MTTAGAPGVARARDDAFMRLAVANASTVRLLAPPNPWVGAVLVALDGEVFQGATAAPGGAHAEICVLGAAGARARGADAGRPTAGDDADDEARAGGG